MKINRCMALAFFASLNLFTHQDVSAQDTVTVSPEAILAQVDYGSGVVIQPKKRDTIFAQLLLSANQTVTITMKYDPALSGQEMIIEPLDGGTVTVPEGGAVIDQNGQITFQFQGTDSPGLSRISVHQFEDGDTLQFWIIDIANPADNPPPDPLG